MNARPPLRIPPAELNTKKVLKRMVELNITRADLGRLTGLSRGYISMLTSDPPVRTPTFETLALLAFHLGFKPRELVK